MRRPRSVFFLYLLLSLALAACTSSGPPVLRYGTPALMLAEEGKLDLGAPVDLYRRTRSGEWREGWSPGDPPDFPFVRASGGMISTAWDYAIFCQMYLNGGVYDGRRILSEESVALATTPHTQELYPPEEWENVGRFYGYGWNVSLDGIYSHGGSDGTWAWVDPANGIVGIIFTQSPGGDNHGSEFASLVTASIGEPD